MQFSAKAKTVRSKGAGRKAIALVLTAAMLFTLGLWVAPVAEAAPTYVEMTGGLNVYSGTNSSGSTVRTTTISGHDYIANVFGTASWASTNAYNFANGAQTDYRATFDSNRGDSAGVGNYFDGATLGHCGVEFIVPQVIARIGYRARQSTDRLNGAILEGSNDGVNYEPIYTLDGSSTTANTYRTGANGLVCNKAYKFVRLSGTSALNGALNPYELKLYTFGNGEAVLETIALPSEVYSEVVLPRDVGGYPITWVSNTPDVINDEGIVVAPEQPRPVAASLTASVDFNGTINTRTFTISVINYEESVDSDIVKDMELIADFNFDDPVAGLAGAGAKATANGTPKFIPGKNGTQAASLSSSFWLNVTKEDGSPLLAGLSEFTVSYDASPATSGNDGWIFFATRTVRAPKNNWESYLGIKDTSTNVTVERYHNFGSRPAFQLYATPAAGWRHVDVVFTKTQTRIYINGVLKNIEPSDYPIEQALSAAGGFLYVGRSTWGSENFTGLIDNFKIWKPYAPDDAGKVAAAKAALTLPYGVSENQVYGNIMLPETGLHGTTVTWETDSPAIVDVNKHENPGYDPRLPGTVTRPAADTVVTMTATITSGDISDTKTFQFTVKKAPAPLAPTEAYIFTFFTGSEGSQTDEQIYFATSLDGTTWKDMTPAGQPILRSTVGELGVRDPYIIRAPEGDKFYLIATDLSVNRRGGWGNASWQTGSTKMVVWESTDLVNWGKERIIDVAGGIPDGGNLWAPEAIYDSKTGDYFVFWATYSTVSNSLGDAQNMYYSRTRDFHTFTTPVKWIDLSGDIIDTTIIQVGEYYYRASRRGAIQIDRSTSLTGTWETLGTLENIFSGSWSYGSVEGPELFLYNEKNWINNQPTWGLMVDRYGQGAGYLPFRSTNLADMSRSSWSVGSNINFGSVKKRHGSIMTITMAEYEAFMAAYSTETPPPAEDEYPTAFGAALTEGMDTLCDFNFNDLPSSGSADITDATGKAKAQQKQNWNNTGSMSRSTTTPDSSAYSYNLTSSRWLNVLTTDGTPLLIGPNGVYDEIIVSFDNRRSSGHWAFYLDRDFNPNASGLGENYIGMLDSGSQITIERFKNGRPGSSYYAVGSYTGGTNTWRHIDLVIRPNSTGLYINGTLAGKAPTLNNTYTLQDILGEAGGLIQFGKANWTSSGEFHTGLIDNIKIYGKYVESDPSQLLTDVKAPSPDYVTIRSDVNTSAKQATLYISTNNSQVKTLTAVPLAFTLFPGATIVNPQAAYDLTSPVNVTVSFDDGAVTEEWTISAVPCNNPVLPGRYADPDILMYNGKYYIYPTTDGYANWSGYQFKVFSSDDLVNWEDEGVILDLQASAPYDNDKGVAVATVPWSNGNAWAPAIEEKDGKFYFYFCGNDVLNSGNRKAIGVAVSDSPTGPFTVRPTPLITLSQCTSAGVGMGQVIDPIIYTEDGISYMLFGNGNAAICQLTEDMMDWVPGTLKNISGATDMREAIMVNKIDGMYHFTWSCDDTGSENYLVRYGISDNLYGPILHKGILLQKDNSQDIKGTGHHTILHNPILDEYFIVYHRFWTPLGQPLTGVQGNNRETCIDRLEYKDGLFVTTKPTNTGIQEPVVTPMPVKKSEDIYFTVKAGDLAAFAATGKALIGSDYFPSSYVTEMTDGTAAAQYSIPLMWKASQVAEAMSAAAGDTFIVSGTNSAVGYELKAHFTVLPAVELVEISGLLPVAPNAPARVSDLIVNGNGVTVTDITWTPDVANFASETVYTAVITLAAEEGYAFYDYTDVFVAGGTTVTKSISGDNMLVTVNFPPTAPAYAYLRLAQPSQIKLRVGQTYTIALDTNLLPSELEFVPTPSGYVTITNDVIKCTKAGGTVILIIKAKDRPLMQPLTVVISTSA